MIGRDILFQLDHNKCMPSSGLLWALRAFWFPPVQSCLAQAAFSGARFRRPGAEIVAWRRSCLAGLEPSSPIFCLVPTAVLEYSAPENVPGNFLKKKSQAERAVYYAKRFLHSKLDYIIHT